MRAFVSVRLPALLLAVLLLFSLSACSFPKDPSPASAEETLVPASPAAESAAPTETAESAGEEIVIVAEEPSPTETAEEPQTAESYVPLLGRWAEAEGRAELWLQDREGEEILFSLFIPGSAGINNVLILPGQGGAFTYTDPYLEGVNASGSLRLENGTPVLTLEQGNLQIPAGTELRFPVRSGEPDYRTLYAPVIEAWQEFELDGGGLENWYADEPGYVHAGITGAEHFGYQFWDLDRSGGPELIVGAIYPPEQVEKAEPGGALYYYNLIIDLYTLDGNEPSYVVNSGDRYRYSLTTDGQIFYEGSGGAAYSDQAVYELREGKLEMVSGLSIDGGEDSCFRVEESFNPERRGYTPISYQECAWLMSSTRDLYLYERFAPLFLRPLLVSEA